MAELEKFKFVLGERIRDFENQIGPKDTALTKLKTQIKAMGEDLQLCHQKGKALSEHIDILKSRQIETRSQLESIRTLALAKKATIREFKRQVAEIATGDLLESESVTRSVAQLLDRFSFSAEYQSEAKSGRALKRLAHEEAQLEMEILALTGAGDLDQIEDMSIAGELLAAEKQRDKHEQSDNIVTREIEGHSSYLQRTARFLCNKQTSDAKAEAEAIQSAVIYNTTLINEIESLRDSIGTLKLEWHRLKAYKAVGRSS
jgi:ribosomal protein L29